METIIIVNDRLRGWRLQGLDVWRKYWSSVPDSMLTLLGLKEQCQGVDAGGCSSPIRLNCRSNFSPVGGFLSQAPVVEAAGYQ